MSFKDMKCFGIRLSRKPYGLQAFSKIYSCNHINTNAFIGRIGYT